ncbi:phage tail tube protein [Kluyvera intermedia]|uniref:Phage tail protein n=1 Tax=Kluyvera intermedia TaxID=61648 RepID=A0ABX6DPQ2_KLUIN|nr:phage tail tube protein [Kluyvera intermedia]QGH30449.1 phage tail protein [Kluyvera intermedia]QGH39431.1 phage tail protein [Kluyvera intermedia]
MPTPNPLAPVKGAGTTLWLYTGTGDPYGNPLSDADWTRLAKIKDLTPGEMTAESYDDTYLDDEDADWSSTAQGEKSAGDTSFTLAWKPGESGQQGLVEWFTLGDVRGYKIKYPNGAIDVFRGWLSSLGKAVPAKEVITRTVKVTNSGKPSLAEEDRSSIVPVTGLSATPTSLALTVGASKTTTFKILPDDATEQSLRIVSSDKSIASITIADNVVTVTGVAAGEAEIIGMTPDGEHVAIATITVTVP